MGIIGYLLLSKNMRFLYIIEYFGGGNCLDDIRDDKKEPVSNIVDEVKGDKKEGEKEEGGT